MIKKKGKVCTVVAVDVLVGWWGDIKILSSGIGRTASTNLAENLNKPMRRKILA